MKRWKRAAALALTGAMVLSLFGCGKQEETETQVTTLAQELGYGYTSAYNDLDVEFSWLRSASTAQGKLYICGEYYNEETYESGTKLYAVDLATGGTQEIPVPEMTETDNSYENLHNISVCPDGSGYWMVTETYTYTVYEGYEDETGEEALPEETIPEEEAAPAEETVPEEEAVEEPGLAGEYSLNLLSNAVEVPAEEAPAEEAPAEEAAEEPVEEPAEEPATEDAAAEEGIMPIDEPVDYSEPEQKYTAKKCDMNGNVLLEIDLTEAAAEQEWFYCQYMAQDGQGNLLVASDNVILCFGPDGARKADVDMNATYIQSMTATGSGTVLVGYYDPDAGQMTMAPVEEGKLGAPLEITGADDFSGSMFPGDGNTILVSNGTLLYSVDVTTGQATRLLSWLDSDINGSNISGLAANGTDKLLVLQQKYRREGMPTLQLGTLTKTPVEELPERTYLTLGAVWLNEELQDAVIDFNQKSDTYRITLIDYSQYNTEEDYNAGAKRLDMDVVSGNCPDLVSLQNGHPEKYIAKGVLADLNEFIDKDDSVSLDQFLSGPLKAYEKDGKLYGIPYGFGMETVYGSYQLLGDRDGWTMEEMAQVIQGLDEDVTVYQYMDQASFLNNMVSENISRFVDYGSASCSFDSDDFKNLMAAASKLQTQEELDQYWEQQEEGVWQDEYQMIQNGAQLMTYGYISGSYEVKNLYGLYVKENGFINIGYPTDSGNGAQLNVYGGIGVSAKSAHKDGAWEFVKTTLTDEFQKELWNLPTKITAFDEIMAEAMEPDYYTDENGEKVEIESTSWIGDTEYSVPLMTQDQVDQFKEYVNGAEVTGSYDDDIYNIISEEAEAYFAGDKTADEVAKLIQNRVSIYLGETS